MDNNNFFAIDKLIEFGMGMAIANQMVKTMNQSMQNMYIPGSVQTMPTVSNNVFYVAINSKPIGPLTGNELVTLIKDKKVNKDTLAWMAGMNAWQPIETIPEILKLIAITPPPLNL